MEWFLEMLVNSGVPEYEAGVATCVMAVIIVTFLLGFARYVLTKK